MGFKVIKGDPALFEGAPEWANIVGEVEAVVGKLRAFEDTETGRYQYAVGFEGKDDPTRIYDGGFVSCPHWIEKSKIIAERVFIKESSLFDGAPLWATRVEEAVAEGLRVWIGNGRYQYLPGFSGFAKETEVFLSGDWPMPGAVVIAERESVKQTKNKKRVKGDGKMKRTTTTLEIQYQGGSTYKVKNPVAMHIVEDFVYILLSTTGTDEQDVVVQNNVRIRAESLEKILVKSPTFESSLYFQDGEVVEFIKGTRRELVTGEYIF